VAFFAAGFPLGEFSSNNLCHNAFFGQELQQVTRGTIADTKRKAFS
jgi:hypothetical protein